MSVVRIRLWAPSPPLPTDPLAEAYTLLSLQVSEVADLFVEIGAARRVSGRSAHTRSNGALGWCFRWYWASCWYQKSQSEVPSIALSDVKCRNAKPASKLVKLSDGGGLKLWVQPTGSRLWRLAYRFDVGKWHPDAIERQLAHIETNDVRRAYARAEHWEERVKMQWWADYLDELESKKARVISIRARGKSAVQSPSRGSTFEPNIDGTPNATHIVPSPNQRKEWLGSDAMAERLDDHRHRRRELPPARVIKVVARKWRTPVVKHEPKPSLRNVPAH